MDEAHLEEGEEESELPHLGHPLLVGLQGRGLPQGRLQVPRHRAEAGVKRLFEMRKKCIFEEHFVSSYL